VDGLLVVEDHLLDFDAFDRSELPGQFEATRFVADDFEDEDAGGGAVIGADFVEAEASLDIAAVFGQNGLHVACFLETVTDVHAEDDVFVHGHRGSLLVSRWRVPAVWGVVRRTRAARGRFAAHEAATIEVGLDGGKHSSDGECGQSRTLAQREFRALQGSTAVGPSRRGLRT